MENTQTEAPKVTNWIEEEIKEIQTTQPTEERFPPLKLEAGKIVSFSIDFSVPFNRWSSSDGVTKALIPVLHKEEKKILWMNLKNPLYHDLMIRGATGQTNFKVSTTGTAKDTRYTIVEED